MQNAAQQKQLPPPLHFKLFIFIVALFFTLNPFGKTAQGQKSFPNDPATNPPGYFIDPTFWVGNPFGEPSEQFLNLRAAWDITTGDPNVKVTIISNGNDWGQLDMPNPDNQLGYNFLDMNTNTSAICTPWHPTQGTEMTSLICSKTNNGDGIFGVAGGWTQNGIYTPGVTPMMIKFDYGEPNEFGILDAASLARLPECLDYAVAKGAKVILITGTYLNPSADDMNAFILKVNEILDNPCNQVTIITSAGNWVPGQSISTDLRFPATVARLISVAGVDETHQIYYKPST